MSFLGIATAKHGAPPGGVPPRAPDTGQAVLVAEGDWGAIEGVDSAEGATSSVGRGEEGNRTAGAGAFPDTDCRMCCRAASTSTKDGLMMEMIRRSEERKAKIRSDNNRERKRLTTKG